MSGSFGGATERPFAQRNRGDTLLEMAADETELLLCPACGAEITTTGAAFCDMLCRDRWRQERRERYARPPGALPVDLRRDLAEELRGGD